MAFKFEVTGIDELINKMSKIPDKGADIAALALYEGAAVMADAVSQAVQGIATAPFRYAKGGRQRLPSPEEKAILMQAKKGVAKFKKTKVRVDTSCGMQNAGYATLKGKTVPIPKIANAINSGTSFMKKQPFFRKAMAKSGAAAAAVESGIKSRLDMLSLD